ncbi:ROK family protein [Actinacidiphila sp. ITFR-21]|uniref:ROK family protein n=1 Tax=Actinacidiphila sp. ITFR-21 TaxID=3075199 RepID=UPI0028899CD1|nr:ROK family protein [Streptomyces sp. ITFR-21]WNI18031.1 ROK family protein [Streptomyces sp. ITFR-21]
MRVRIPGLRRAAGQRHVLTRPALKAGRQPSGTADGETLAADAHSGDAIALPSFDTSVRAPAAAVAAVATSVEIEVAVIGGGVAEAHDVLFSPLRRHLAAYAVLPSPPASVSSAPRCGPTPDSSGPA